MVGKVRSMDTITKHQNHTEENFVTVVSVGSEPSCVLKTKCDTFTPVDPNSSGYITVLTIGDSAQDCVANEDVIEEVLVYRLPGERLGFGLKFEGGTKANEFVKRLFIQSCAPDSPASRVQCSWGKLSEGDEVLEIDSMSVNTMTRIDCVRCLKDSNVVIKLLVRHFISKKPTADGKQLCDKTRSVEDLPQVISAEKKRTPPPPPPVPPRKIPKKFYKNSSNNHSNINNSAETSAQFSRQMNTEVTINVKSKKFQSPRSSGKSSYSPDIPRRDRRFSDGSIGPPDAEVYVDLFSQESMQNLSESDDTGSSISTVVDRFASFPTTTTSSFAGSLPSTPTSIQKHIDFSNLLNSYDDDELTLSFNANNNEIKANIFNNKNVEHAEKQKDERSYETVNEDGTPLQPPSCFQDAPLSYGNEDMRIIESKSNEINKLNLPKSLHLHQQTYPDIQDDKHCENNVNSCNEEKIVKKPPVPPRSRDLINTHIKLNSFKEFHNNNNNIHDENMNISNLPRLVDFVPKSVRKNYENPVEIINVFLENERKDSDYYKTDYYEEIDDPNLNVYTNDMDIYSSKWSLSSQLATIGEDEEEGNQDVTLNRSPLNSTPIVIVENADNDIQSDEQCLIAIENHQQNQNQVQKVLKFSTNGKMDGLTSDSRQPPDGHESPDYIETKNIEEKFNNNNAKTDLYNDSLAMNMKNVNSSQIRSSLSDLTSTSEMNNHRLLIQNKNSVSAMDLSSTNLNLYSMQNSKLHQNIITQSLLGLSTMNSEKKERLTLSDQRKQTHSKLKGLIIPEHVSDLNVNPVVNIPEIISHNQPSFVLEAKVKPTSETMQCHANDNNASEPVALPLLSPPWALNATTLPKYSPAFKRKSLQVYPVKDKKHYNEPQSTAIKTMPIQNVTNSCATLTKSKLANSELRIDNLFDAPKSLESITSPTRSDCSFDYVTNTFNKVKANQQESSKVYMTRKKKDSNKSEEDSDNDSALSSSQSSFVSRSSPPPSPTRSCESVDYDNNKRKSDWIQDESCRLLKAASVEAINRKNILASAKCRSGKDLTGSPVIQRKYEEDGDNEANDKDNANNNEAVGPSNDSSSSAHSTTIDSLINQPVNILNQQENNSSAHVMDENVKQNEPNVLPKVITKAKGKQKTTNDTKSIKQVEHTTLVKLKPVLNIPKLPSSMTTTNSTNYSLRSSLLLKNNNNRMSVTDIRKNFEKPSVVPLPKKIHKSSLLPMKSPKSEVKTLTTNVSNTSISSKPKESTEVSKLKSHKNQTVQIKKATASTPTEKEINNIANNVKTNSNNHSNTKNSRKTIVLCPEILGGSTGLTLAGGTDYETKEITVHRIRYGSVAYNNGKLKKGDRIISINGKDTNGLTHAQSVELLKEAVAEYELVVEDGVAESPTTPPQRKSFIYETPSPKSPTLSKKTANHVVTLVKDGAGLGFSIDGGKGSLHGDLPLRIKKIFQGGTADKCGGLVIGDELLAINDISLSDLSKIEAWNLMKKIPDGQVSIHINR